jgi:hypothetical protein
MRWRFHSGIDGEMIYSLYGLQSESVDGGHGGWRNHGCLRINGMSIIDGMDTSQVCMSVAQRVDGIHGRSCVCTTRGRPAEFLMITVKESRRQSYSAPGVSRCPWCAQGLRWAGDTDWTRTVGSGSLKLQYQASRSIKMRRWSDMRADGRYWYVVAVL